MWIKRSEYNNVRDIVVNRIGQTEDLLLNDQRDYVYPNIDKAATLLLKHLKSGSKIRVYGDYDSDGITSLAIFKVLFSAIKYHEVELIAPHRFTDGYGINTMRIKQFYDEGCNLLITIDNGVTALNAIRLAKNLGMTVIILDHHQPFIDTDGNTVLPEADVIVDPHVTGGFVQGTSEEFKDLCGAGIGYQFIKEVLRNVSFLSEKEKQECLDSAICMAGIGTVADVVPLIGDNRIIVRNALTLLSQGKGTVGLKKLLETLNMQNISSESIAFGISPCLNASGRLYDDGAQNMVSLLGFSDDSDELGDLCNAAKDANEERKTLTADAISRAQDYLLLNPVSNVIVIVDEDLTPGIAGLVASRLTEQFYKPSIVLCRDCKGICKGSGRSVPSVNLKEILDECQDILLGYGGHPAAAGLSLKGENVESFKKRLNELVPRCDAPKEVYYDIECAPDKVKLENLLEEIMKYEPYGCGNEPLRIMLPNVRIGDRMGNTHKFMGAEKKHIKLLSRYGFDIVWFNGADQYKSLGSPKCIDVIGSLGSNIYNGKMTLQFSVSNLRLHET